MNVFDKIFELTKSLYPTGRAFKMPSSGFLEKLHLGLTVSEANAYEDAMAILYSILPDNSNFTADDASDWERRLGMITNSLTSLEDRKKAISRKLNYPGLNPAKGSALSLERGLQLAGFDVYVYENIPAQTPFDFSGINTTTTIQHGQIQHGQSQHGLTYTNKIANHIDEAKDLYFNLGGSYKSSFFIADLYGGNANVLLSRKAEFRQTILKLKQVQSIGFLFVNYI